MSAGLIYSALGHDRIAGLSGIARELPLSGLAFALGGLALIGLPPSGAYLAKELLLGAAMQSGQWWWAIVIQAGGVLTSSYVLLVLAHAFARASGPATRLAPIPRISEAAALALGLCSVLLGFVAWDAFLPVARGSLSSPSGIKTLISSLWPVVGGIVLAMLLGRWENSLYMRRRLVAILNPARRACLPLSRSIEQVDGTLRNWPVACFSLHVVAILLGAALTKVR